jgi:hypothetical protein
MGITLNVLTASQTTWNPCAPQIFLLQMGQMVVVNVSGTELSVFWVNRSASFSVCRSQHSFGTKDSTPFLSISQNVVRATLLLCAHLDQREEFGVSQLRGAGPCQMPMIADSQSAFFSWLLSGPVASLKWPAVPFWNGRVLIHILSQTLIIETICKNPLHVLSNLANHRVVLKLNCLQAPRRKIFQMILGQSKSKHIRRTNSIRFSFVGWLLEKYQDIIPMAHNRFCPIFSTFVDM